MSDASLCPGYDHQTQCATCWRRYVQGDPSRTNHPYPPNEYWQAWITPAPSDSCGLYVPQDNGREAPRVRK